MKKRTDFPRVGFYIREPTRDRVNKVKDMLSELGGCSYSQDETIWWLLEKCQPELERVYQEKERILAA